MPVLTWASKNNNAPTPARLQTDSLMFPHGSGYPHAGPQNRLIYGDNLAVMAALLPEYEGKIDLIYADPPFFTNRRFPARVGRGEDSRRPREWRLADGYPDDWVDLDSYLDMLYPRLQLMHRLLSPTGCLYLHLDWHANSYARLLLDEIFGADRLINEIVWVYHGPSPIRSAFNRKHDTILAYSKGKEYTFNVDAVREPYDPSTLKTFAASRKAGFGKIPDLKRGKVPEDWWYFPVIARLHTERTGYPTQKPEALLERIILASSQPGDLVADFFCGAGTTPAVAERTGRRFLAVDSTWRAIHTTRVRLIAQAARPFRLEVTEETPLEIHTIEPGSLPLVCSTGSDGLEVTLQTAALPELDYWEIDPVWDGKVFRSAVQASRPLRNQRRLPETLTIPEQVLLGKTSSQTAQQACLRCVSIVADRYQIPFRIP